MKSAARLGHLAAEYRAHTPAARIEVRCECGGRPRFYVDKRASRALRAECDSCGNWWDQIIPPAVLG